MPRVLLAVVVFGASRWIENSPSMRILGDRPSKGPEQVVFVPCYLLGRRVGLDAGDPLYSGFG